MKIDLLLKNMNLILIILSIKKYKIINLKILIMYNNSG